MKICLGCGDLADQSVYCEDCFKEKKQQQRKTNKKQVNARKNGYDSRWTRLSLRARKLQPFCSECGSTEDLQADHSPEAWERWYAGLPVRLQDIDVVCREHNISRGKQRPDLDKDQGGEGTQSPLGTAGR